MQIQIRKELDSGEGLHFIDMSDQTSDMRARGCVKSIGTVSSSRISLLQKNRNEENLVTQHDTSMRLVRQLGLVV